MQLQKYNIPFLRQHSTFIFDKFRGKKKSAEQLFSDIYVTNRWNSKESRSGKGSELVITRILRRELPILLKELNVKTMLDVPCGDFNWLKEVDISFLEKYIGADIVSELIEANRELYRNEFSNIEFEKIDVVVDTLPETDMILCRDLFIRLSFEDIDKALDNIRKSNSKYVLATSFPSIGENIDIETGKHHPVNLLLPPFSFPEPMRSIKEFAQNPNLSKILGLWMINDIPKERS